ncbi:uncharacterized protein LOC100369686, partial [Saccoglossus kowalevskii]|uniref:Uncharacterized protein LOC100369686 n=1 Tax=Saccoglossus kowalevskii TaxID=10224 RepID=A0ABM0GXC3_SACKO
MAVFCDFSRLRVPDLKKYLTDRRIPCAGKKKNELVELAQKASGIYDVIEDCDHDESERKRRRVLNDDGTVAVNLNGKQVVWTRTLHCLPKVALGDVFAYLIKNCEWTPERLTKYKHDDGYLMFKDNHVEDVLLGKVSGHIDHVYVKAEVKPEQRQTAQRYATWLLLSSDAEVMSAGCGCVAADDGSCKHTAALLFAVAEYVDRQTDRGTAVSTDETCVWTKPRKTSIPVKVEDLDYRRDKTTPRKPGPQPKNYRPLRTVNNTDILRIQEHLKR